MKGFARADLETFVAEHYRPGQMILAAAGAVDHGALVRAAEGFFGDMGGRRPPSRRARASPAAKAGT